MKIKIVPERDSLEYGKSTTSLKYIIMSDKDLCYKCLDIPTKLQKCMIIITLEYNIDLIYSSVPAVHQNGISCLFEFTSADVKSWFDEQCMTNKKKWIKTMVDELLDCDRDISNKLSVYYNRVGVHVARKNQYIDILSRIAV